MILDIIIAISITAFVASLLVLLLIGLNSVSKAKKSSFSDGNIVVLDEKNMKMLTPDKEDVQAMESGVSFERAFVRCRATNSDIDRLFNYRGSPDCKSIMNSFRGDRACPWACLGKGDCVDVCSVKAISVLDGLARIGAQCTGCGACVDACPLGIIELVPRNADFLVPCASREGEKTAEYCSLGCTGCSKCEYAGAYAGYYVRNNLASIDYRRIGSRSIGAESCPSHCILKSEDFYSNFVEKKGFWSILGKIRNNLKGNNRKKNGAEV